MRTLFFLLLLLPRAVPAADPASSPNPDNREQIEATLVLGDHVLAETRRDEMDIAAMELQSPILGALWRKGDQFALAIGYSTLPGAFLLTDTWLEHGDHALEPGAEPNAPNVLKAI